MTPMTTDPRHFRSICLSAMVALAMVSACIAQDRQPVEQLPEPGVFLDAVRQAYRAGPIGEHVTVRVKDASGRRTTGRLKLFLSVDPVADASMVRIEFDPLQVWWGGDTLIAISERNETIFYSEVLPGKPDFATISSALRPVPLPQLEMAFSDDVSFSMPTSYTPDTIWTSATLGTSGLGGSEVVVIEGISMGRTISFTIDPRTDRIRTFHAEIGPPDEPDAIVLDLEFRSFEPPPVEEWTIRTAGRRRVDQVIDLLPRRGPVHIGDLAPEIELLNEATIPWRLEQTLDAMTADEIPSHALALILFRHNADEQIQEEFVVSATRAITAIDIVLAQPLKPAPNAQAVEPGVTFPWRVTTQAGVVFRLGDYSPLVYRQLVERWGGESTRDGTLLWDHSPSRSIDWFDRNAGAVLVLVAMNRTVLLAESLDASTNVDDLATLIAEALRMAHPPYSLVPPLGDPAMDDQPHEHGPPPPL